MLRLNRFQYLAPSSVAAASAALRLHGPEATLMGGGTDVLVNIKHRLATPRVLVSIRQLPELQVLSLDADQWTTIGAAVTLRRLENDPGIQQRYPGLAQAAHLISTPQVRAVGTLGGNVCLDVRCNYYNQSYEWRKAIGFCLKRDSEVCRVAPGGDRCWAVASADTVPVLVALRAEVTIVGQSAVRRLPLENLYQDDGLLPTALGTGDIVTAIHVPPPDGYRCVYHKFRLRQSFDFPLVGVAVAARCREGVVEDARIVLTAVASYPQRARVAETFLVGRELTAETIAAAAETIFRLARPMDNTAGSVFHRKRMARVLTERALRDIVGDPSTEHLAG